MGIYLVGEPKPGGAVFDRAFFVKAMPSFAPALEKQGRLTMFLGDGTTLDVCAIEELAETYLVVRASVHGGAECPTTIQLLPYGLVYRIEIAPLEEDEPRVGFQWKPVKE